MSAEHRKYYLVEPGSPVMEVIEQAQAKHRAFNGAAIAFKEEIGATGVIAMDNSHLVGAEFADDVPLPEGWRWDKKAGYYVPAKKTPEGRAIAKRLDEIPRGVGALSLADMLRDAKCGSFLHIGGGYAHWPGSKYVGDKVILVVHEACKDVPPGCKLLKASEYFAMIEAQEELERSGKSV